MKTKLPHMTGALILGINMACAGEGLSVNKKNEENVTMTAATNAREGDSGSFESESSGRKILNLSVDVAATTLVFVPMDKDFKVSWQKGDSCDRIEVKETSSGLEVKHLDRDGSCGESKVDLLVNEKLSTRFDGGAGYLNVKGMGKFLSNADHVSAAVMAGQIDSHIRELEVERKWSQMTAFYDGDKNTGIALKITLGAGNIVFSR